MNTNRLNRHTIGLMKVKMKPINQTQNKIKRREQNKSRNFKTKRLKQTKKNEGLRKTSQLISDLLQSHVKQNIFFSEFY